MNANVLQGKAEWARGAAPVEKMLSGVPGRWRIESLRPYPPLEGARWMAAWPICCAMPPKVSSFIAL